MKELPTEDKPMGKGSVRIDGRKIHPMYLFEVKKPDESKGPWDYFNQLATIPAKKPGGRSTKANVRWCENDLALQNPRSSCPAPGRPSARPPSVPR